MLLDKHGLPLRSELPMRQAVPGMRSGSWTEMGSADEAVTRRYGAERATERRAARVAFYGKKNGIITRVGRYNWGVYRTYTLTNWKELGMDSVAEKRCTRCGELKPRTAEYFYRRKSGSWDGLMSHCKACKESDRRAKNDCPEERKKNAQRMRVYMEAHPEQVEKRRLGVRAWREANPEKVQAVAKKSYEKNKPKVLARRREYRSRNSDKVNHWRKIRRTLKAGAEGSYTQSEWEAKLALYKGRCHWCGEHITGKTHADHVIPLIKGGTNYITNIVPACVTCNLSKHAKLPHEFNGRLF